MIEDPRKPYAQDAYAVTQAKRQPYAAFRRVPVTFATAGVDVEVTHDLPVTTPDDVEVLAYNWQLADDTVGSDPTVYRFTGPNSRPWTNTLISVRATRAGQCTLLLTVAPRGQ